MIKQSAPSYQYEIYIAGPYERALDICAEYCERGFCVSVSRTCFVYRHGREDGVCVTLINYARFPTSRGQLRHAADKLASALMDGLHQGSYSIVGREESVFVSRRPQDTGGSK